jgi:hypothetical protein
MVESPISHLDEADMRKACCKLTNVRAADRNRLFNRGIGSNRCFSTVEAAP